ncbi:MAG: carboxypeptidase-like regulatory domain-containing protein [Streptosporangiaceae bacterium]
MGQEYWKAAGDGTYRVVLPTVVAARERVSQNEAFELDDLAPGRYVILARYTGSNTSTYVDVSVAPGQVVTVNLPDTCK